MAIETATTFFLNSDAHIPRVILLLELQPKEIITKNRKRFFACVYGSHLRAWRMGNNLNVHKKVSNHVNCSINYVIHLAMIMASDR